MSRTILVGILAALTVGTTAFGLAPRPVSADVTFNERIEVVRSNENPCEAGTIPIYLSGVVHHVWYTTPQNTVKMNIQSHLSGEDANGTLYVLNTQQHMEHFAWPLMTPFTDVVRTNLVSKGSQVNAIVVRTFDVPAGAPSIPTTTVTACVG